jgi:hypothetical protein
LFYFVRFGAAAGWAGAGAAFYRHHVAVSGYALQAGQHVEERSHIGWLFLHPDYFAGIAVAGEFSG